MAHGYRMTIFGDRDETFTTTLMCGDLLDHELEQLMGYLREWLTRPVEGEIGENARYISVSLTGPFPEQSLRHMSMTAEQRLDEAKSEDDRFEALGFAAKSRFNEGDTELAVSYVRELEDLARRRTHHPFYGCAIADFNVVLGRVALMEGRKVDAIAHLRAAGQVTGSPTLMSFGPNMSLARDLLLAGEANAVLGFLEDCRVFWQLGSADLDKWQVEIENGKMPDFGANLVY